VWRDTGRSASENMAWDETLLAVAAEQACPVLRFYSWPETAATFGYFQHISDIENWTALRPLIRRPTGGGLVPHDHDWTYSMAVPTNHAWYALRAEDSYRRLHEWISAAFTHLGLRTELAPCCDKKLPGRCFAGPEKFDLVWQSEKLGGAAQRRTKDGLLIQGSIQPPPPNLSRECWETAMQTIGEKALGIRWAPLETKPSHEARARELAGKYASDAFNRRR
jgi:lipoate-protein ligase A